MTDIITLLVLLKHLNNKYYCKQNKQYLIFETSVYF